MGQITIDGPSGAGKSTIAKRVAEILAFMYVDTGAMYRTLALYCLENGADKNDEERIGELTKDAPVHVKYEDGVQKMFLGDRDVSSDIRNDEISSAASDISKFECVREKLVSMQRDLCEDYNIVMDGRDIGTVVLPDADLKIYLTASVDERARRRYKEYKEKGMDVTFDEVREDIIKRDYNDMNRKISPLKKADDAFEIDSSDMSIEEVTDKVVSLWKSL